MTVGLPLAHQHGLLMTPNIIHNNTYVLVVQNSQQWHVKAYVIYHEETRAVLLCGMARFPVSRGNKPSSTYAEASTISLALHHAYRILHPGNEYVTH